MAQYDVYALGNALVDYEFEVDAQQLEELGIEKGIMTLVDEARQNTVMNQLHGTAHNRASGGSAANTAIAVAKLGSRAFYSCRVADDESGSFYRHDLEEAGVHSQIKATNSGGQTGKCLVMVTPDADRTMNTFLGVSADLNVDDIRPEALEHSKYLYIEGYLSSSETAMAAALKAKQLARINDVRIALSLSDPSMVSFFPDQLGQLLEGGIDVLFCNKDEALSYSGSDDLHGAIAKLAELAQEVVVTLGPDGVALHANGNTTIVPGFAVSAVDTNGAGDMFAGAYLHGINSQLSSEQAARLAGFAASRLVTHFGPRLPDSAWQEVLDFDPIG